MPSYSHEKRLSTILELAFGAKNSEVTLVQGDANGQPIMQDINYSRATALSLASANITLTGANAAAMILEVTTGHATNAILAPTNVIGNHYWVINNDAVNSVTIKKSGGTGVTFPSNSAGLVYYNGTDYVLLSNDSKVITSPAIVSGTPSASATSSLIQLGTTAIAGGSAAGTYLGANAATTYAGDLVDLQQNSVLVYQVSSVASAVNGLKFQLTATGNTPAVSAIGSDTDIGLNITPKGAGIISINVAPPAASAKALLQLGPTAIAGVVNGTYLGANAATAYAGDLIDLQQNSVAIYQVQTSANAVNGIGFIATTTTAPPVLQAIGSDTNINLWIRGKGTGFPVINGLGLSMHNVTGSAQTYTATAADSVITCNAVSTSCTITLPQGATYAGKEYTVYKDASAITVAVTPASGSILGWTGPLATGAIHSVTLVSDGTNYIAKASV